MRMMYTEAKNMYSAYIISQAIIICHDNNQFQSAKLYTVYELLQPLLMYLSGVTHSHSKYHCAISVFAFYKC